ncbi:MAG TPA: hypothetical protein VLM17_03490 [Xanthomonadaceae bacterium]|nr:hypothetical protein [Xanthomonadaceae bacterium]
MNIPMFSILGLAIGTLLAAVSDAPRRPAPTHAAAATAAGAAWPTGGLVAASAQPVPKPGRLVKLRIVSPLYKPTLPYGIEFASGWPLVIRAVGSPTALGIATNAGPVEFPGIGQTGYLILADPDACLELPPPFFRGNPPCSTAESDETYVEFTPDADAAGAQDHGGNPGRLLALADPGASGEPRYDGVGDDGDGDNILDPVETPVGPATGAAVSDGLGYGADDDLPGLVLLSPVGPGLVLNADFSRPAVLTQRNLAGFLGQVGYELNDPDRSTSFTASMLVPTGLVAPVLKVDGCVGTYDNGVCDGATRYQVDGGPIRDDRGSISVQALYPQLVNAMPYYEVRAFLVSGIAPSTLADLDHDGRVTAADARLAGYDVISNEEVVRVRQYATDICTGVPLANVVYADFDGNGHATSLFVCPAGPGQITKPPQ